MLLKILFANQPELFYTINLIPGILIAGTKSGQLTLALASGLALICASLIIFLIFYFKKSSEKNYQAILLSLIAVAWLPIYVNFTYNNLYDLSENFEALKFKKSSRTVLRICNIDNRQNSDGALCRIFSFVALAKKNLPAGANVELLAAPGMNAYFNYYLYPEHKIVDQADYLLFYYPSDYIFKDNILYKKQGGENLIIGEYKILSFRNDAELILKKP